MRFILPFLLLLQLASSFNISSYISRRQILASGFFLAADKSFAYHNPPLTPLEMDEYKKLFKQFNITK